MSKIEALLCKIYYSTWPNQGTLVFLSVRVLPSLFVGPLMGPKSYFLIWIALPKSWPSCENRHSSEVLQKVQTDFLS